MTRAFALVGAAEPLPCRPSQASRARDAEPGDGDPAPAYGDVPAGSAHPASVGPPASAVAGGAAAQAIVSRIALMSDLRCAG